VEKTEKTYVGSGKTIGNYGHIRIGLRYEDLKNHVNDSGYVNLIIGERKSKGKHGETHSVWVDDWKPEKNYKPKTEDTDIPF